MNKIIRNMLKQAVQEIKKNPRKCAVCGITEDIHNVILIYDNGQAMCDECAFEFYKEDLE